LRVIPSRRSTAGSASCSSTSSIAGGYRTAQVGLYYTGRPEVQIGSDVFYSKNAVASGGSDLDGIQFRLVTRIDF